MVTPQRFPAPAGMVTAQIRAPRSTVTTTPVRVARPRTATLRSRQPFVRPVVNVSQPQPQLVTTQQPQMTGARPRFIARVAGIQQPTVLSIGSQNNMKTIIARNIATVNKGGVQTVVQTTPAPSTSISSTATTITEDLEDSITAATIAKQPTIVQSPETQTIMTTSLPNQTQALNDEQRIGTMGNLLL